MKKTPYFILTCDVPPSPFDEREMKWYEELFNTYILTEDFLPFVDEQGKLSKEYQRALETLKKYDLGVLVRNMYNDPDYFDNEKDKTGSNYGYEYRLTKRHITDEFLSYDNVVGFYMADEPFAKRFSLHPNYPNIDDLKKLVTFKNKYYPKHLFHMNMVPSSSFDHYYLQKDSGAYWTYEDFIQHYIDVIVKNLNDGERTICLDNYPFIHENYIEFDYLNDLLTVSNLVRYYNQTASIKKKARFGICVQTFDCRDALEPKIHRDIISSEEISFQLFTGIALGATFFEYFCFKTTPDFDKAILDKNNQQRIHHLVKKANDDSLWLEHYLKDKQWVGAKLFRSDNPYLTNRTYKYVDKFLNRVGSLTSISTDIDILCGYFTNDKDSYVLVNYSDPINKQIAHGVLTFNKGEEILLVKNNNEQRIILDNGHCDIELKYGEGIYIEVLK